MENTNRWKISSIALIGIEGIQILIFIGAFRFLNQNKKSITRHARLILVNYKPENWNLMLLQEPVKEYKPPY
jgi:DNA polymerase-3 subunit alpha/error-prone DNA polymerase